MLLNALATTSVSSAAISEPMPVRTTTQLVAAFVSLDFEFIPTPLLGERRLVCADVERRRSDEIHRAT
jgi:hypothetical protein